MRLLLLIPAALLCSCVADGPAPSLHLETKEYQAGFHQGFREGLEYGRILSEPIQ